MFRRRLEDSGITSDEESEEDISEYERDRKKRIRENNHVLRVLMNDIPSSEQDKNVSLYNNYLADPLSIYYLTLLCRIMSPSESSLQ